MSNNSTTLRLLSVLLIGLLLSAVSIADAQTVTELQQKIGEKRKVMDKKKSDHDDATAHLNTMIGNFVTLHANLVNIKISVTPATSLADLIPEFTKIVEALTKSNLLTSAMRTMLTNIETQRGKCNTIWADVVLAQTAYEDAVDAYNDAVSPSEQVQADPMPQADSVSKLYLCPGPCSTPFTTQVLATTSHKVFCAVPPHKGTNEYSYYSCPPDYKNLCPAKGLHKAPCRGGCGTLFETDLSGLPKDSSHIKGCDERTSRSLLNGWTGNCIGKYDSCNGQTSADCNNAENHVKKGSSSSSKSASLSGSGSASAGSLYRVSLTTASAYSSVFWYVRSPGGSGKGSFVTEQFGSSGSTSASLLHQFASSASAGDYVITAKVYNYADMSVYEVSHTVRVGSSSGSSKPPKVVNVKTEKSAKKPVVKKEVSPLAKSPDASTQQPQAQQPQAQQPQAQQPSVSVVKCANNNRLSGKCVYGRKVSGTDAYEHLTTCRAGHKYWSCNATAVAAHTSHKAPTTNTNNNNNGNSGSNSSGSNSSGSNTSGTSNNNGNTPSSPSQPSPPPPPKPTPKPKPKKIVCPAHRWTNCGGTSSHATTCRAGHTYYSCNPEAVSAHKNHKPANPVKCPAHSWTSCGGTSSHATTCKAGHTYYSCNPKAVSAHKNHKKPNPVKCPAHAWTKCGGTSSHAKKCRQGHLYYTCNPKAVSAHRWH